MENTPNFPAGMRAQFQIYHALDTIDAEKAYRECAHAASKGMFPTREYDEVLKDTIVRDSDYYNIQRYLDNVRRHAKGNRAAKLKLLESNLAGHLHGILYDLFFDTNDDDEWKPYDPAIHTSTPSPPKSVEMNESLIENLGSVVMKRICTPVEFEAQLSEIGL